MTAAIQIKQDVKCRLFPLSALTQFLENMIERLPRRCVNVSLNPMRDITILNAATNEYKATGSLPSFEIPLGPALANGGWFYIEAALVRHTGSREAYLNIKTANTYPMAKIPVPSNLRGTVREVVYLPKQITTLHWVPMTASGYFSQSALLIHKISRLESILRRLHRVGMDLWRYRHVPSAARGGLSWCGAIFNLHQAYLKTAYMQIKRYNGHDYVSFIERNDTYKPSHIDTMRRQQLRLQFRPLISLIIAVENPQYDWLLAMLEAVAGQIYTNWQLCLSGDLGHSPDCLALVQKWQERDERIKFVQTPELHSKANLLNNALQHSHGQYVAELGQHDLLPQYALFEVVKMLSQHPDADLVYTDHDALDKVGKRCNPCFKPDWNADLFTSYNYLSSLCVYRLEKVKQLNSYHAGFEGAEAYDLALRFVEHTQPSNIIHIHRVLYHKREEHLNAQQDLFRHESGRRALQAHFSGTGASVEDGAAPGLYRIRYPLPAQPPLVSIIIPTRDKLDILKKCVESIQQKTDYPNWEILIIDNQSEEAATHAWLHRIQQDSRIRVLPYNQPFNYSAINNFAVDHARGKVLALLNNDVEVITPEWLSEMVSHAIRPGIGAVGAKLLYPNGLVQHAGVVLGIGGVAGHVHKYLGQNELGYCYRAAVTQNFTAVTGACLVVKKAAYQEVGGLDSANLKVAFNDVDFCIKLAKYGYLNVFTPFSKLYHHESLSRGHDDTPEKQKIFNREFEYMRSSWARQLAFDKAYNCNLSMRFEDFSLNF